MKPDLTAPTRKAGYPSVTEGPAQVIEAMKDLDIEPKKRDRGPALLVRLDADLLAQFHAACDEDERTANETVRRLIRQYLEERHG